MLASLVFPLIFFMCRGGGKLICMMALILTLALSVEDGPQHFFYMFVLGIIVHLHGKRLAERFSTSAINAISLAAIALIVVPELFTLGHAFLTDLLMSTGAFVLIVIIATRPDAGVLFPLDWAATRFLGRVSYSFYLIHLAVLLAVMRLAFEYLPDIYLTRAPFLVMASSALVSVSVGLCIAWVLYRLVEEPSNNLGRNLSKHFRQKRAITAALSD
jgi:peptidoglycan/LPS O-acetylase OafA/YrhL